MTNSRQEASADEIDEPTLRREISTGRREVASTLAMFADHLRTVDAEAAADVAALARRYRAPRRKRSRI